MAVSTGLAEPKMEAFCVLVSPEPSLAESVAAADGSEGVSEATGILRGLSCSLQQPLNKLQSYCI